MPEPRALQLLPFHLAILVAATPPAVVKLPPAYRSLPDTASAATLVKKFPLPTPESNALQLVPFHLAMYLAGTPPAVVKLPPAYRSLPNTASVNTGSFIPEPSALQLSAFHLAIRFA